MHLHQFGCSCMVEWESVQDSGFGVEGSYKPWAKTWLPSLPPGNKLLMPYTSTEQKPMIRALICGIRLYSSVFITVVLMGLKARFPLSYLCWLCSVNKQFNNSPCLMEIPSSTTAVKKICLVFSIMTFWQCHGTFFPFKRSCDVCKDAYSAYYNHHVCLAVGLALSSPLL